MQESPLILTLKIDADAQRYFDQLRSLHFPPERNFLNAHLTLFHKLPSDQEEIISDLETLANTQSRFTMLVADIALIGNGVAFKIDSERLKDIHHQLQKKWRHHLSQQDVQGLWPHITIQNKVAPDIAKALKEELTKTFEPFSIEAQGLSLWKYLGGPWEWVRDFNF